jgi:hypothetical protein
MSALIRATSPRFVNNLRARRGTIDLSRGAESITIRVECPDVWDTVRIRAASTEPVESIKRAAIEALTPEVELSDDLVLKLRGWEILDERATLGECGAIDGSIFLMTYRRRRPVR